MKNKFYLFEGVDGSGKTSLARLLAEEMEGIYYNSPPEAIEPLRAYANASSADVRLRYYLFGNYITSHEVKEKLSERSVMVDKYIYSTIAFHSILLDRNIPVETTDGLLLPDHIIHLTAPMETIERRLAARDSRSNYEKIDYLEKVDRRYKDIFSGLDNVLTINTGATTPKEALALI